MSWKLNFSSSKQTSAKRVSRTGEKMCSTILSRLTSAITNFYLCFCFHVLLLTSFSLSLFFFAYCSFLRASVWSLKSYIFHIVYVRRFNRTSLIEFAESLPFSLSHFKVSPWPVGVEKMLCAQSKEVGRNFYWFLFARCFLCVRWTLPSLATFSGNLNNSNWLLHTETMLLGMDNFCRSCNNSCLCWQNIMKLKSGSTNRCIFYKTLSWGITKPKQMFVWK